MDRIATNNATRIVSELGAVAAPLLSRVFSVGELSEDLVASALERDAALTPRAFLVIPRGSGTVHVHMAGAPFGETYVISSVEVEASLGYPLPYLVDCVIADSDTTASISVGW